MRGFTLIELSIVLVIIGLIVGGVLVGRDLISSAGVRAQVSQIEKYQTAVNTFRQKYAYLPGDILSTEAARFGFQPRGVNPLEGDGNGVIACNPLDEAVVSASGFCPISGEEGVFWTDLSVAKLVDGYFNNTSFNALGCCTYTGNTIAAFLPAAKLKGWIYVWSGGFSGDNGVNYFALADIDNVDYISAAGRDKPSLTVRQAMNIDSKIDDGFPQSGNVTAATPAAFLIGGAPGIPGWMNGAGGLASNYGTTATPGSATTCFDNNNSGGARQVYSITTTGGNGTNCALSFKFQ